MEQEPGPLGSPHDPHGSVGTLDDENDFAGLSECAANTESSLVRSAPWHAGQLGDRSWRVRYSK
jgi:hypothetical protein